MVLQACSTYLFFGCRLSSAHIGAVFLLCVEHAVFPVTSWVHTSHQRTCSLPCSPSALPNFHHLPSPRKSALEGSFPTNCATFPGHRQALRPSSNQARSGADSVCLRVRCYQQHALTRPYTQPPTHTTPLHAKTLNSNHTPEPHEQPVTGTLLGFVSAATKDRVALHIHLSHSINTPQTPTPTPLGKVYTRALVGVIDASIIWCQQP